MLLLLCCCCCCRDIWLVVCGSWGVCGWRAGLVFRSHCSYEEERFPSVHTDGKNPRCFYDSCTKCVPHKLAASVVDSLSTLLLRILPISASLFEQCVGNMQVLHGGRLKVVHRAQALVSPSHLLPMSFTPYSVLFSSFPAVCGLCDVRKFVPGVHFIKQFQCSDSRSQYGHAAGMLALTQPAISLLRSFLAVLSCSFQGRQQTTLSPWTTRSTC